MRTALISLHGYAGLVSAIFLFISGVTGAIISWDYQPDDFLNPHLIEARAGGKVIPSLDLARQIEKRYAEIRVTYVPLHAAAGKSLPFRVAPR